MLCWYVLGGRRVGTYVERDEGARGRDGLVLPKAGRAVPSEARTNDGDEGEREGGREEGEMSQHIFCDGRGIATTLCGSDSAHLVLSSAIVRVTRGTRVLDGGIRVVMMVR